MKSTQSNTLKFFIRLIHKTVFCPDKTGEAFLGIFPVTILIASVYVGKVSAGIDYAQAKLRFYQKRLEKCSIGATLTKSTKTGL